jgi:hypothetical protein
MILRRTLLSLVAAAPAAALASGCIADARDDEFASTDGELKLTKKYSGEDLFRGIFFGKGEVAKVLPEIWGASSVLKSRKQEPAADTLKRMDAAEKWLRDHGKKTTADRIKARRDTMAAAVGHWPTIAPPTTSQMEATINKIKSKDSAFFTRFATEIQSGNTSRVKATFLDASQLMLAEMPAIAPLDSTNGLVSVKVNNAGSVAVWLIVAVAVIVVLFAMEVGQPLPDQNQLATAIAANQFTGRLAFQ